jgi:hypothetical protein
VSTFQAPQTALIRPKDGPTGHKVVFAPFENGQPVAPPSSTDGTVDIVFTDPSIDTSTCKSEPNPTGAGCLAPVGLALDTAGRLFISSDQSGEIFVLTKAD